MRPSVTGNTKLSIYNFVDFTFFCLFVFYLSIFNCLVFSGDLLAPFAPFFSSQLHIRLPNTNTIPHKIDLKKKNI